MIIVKEFDEMIQRIELIRGWLEKGVFWDSIDDEGASADLGPLPEVQDMDADDLQDLFDYLEDLYCDLNENTPAEGSAAFRVRAALRSQIEKYEESIQDRLGEIEAELF